MSNIIDFASRRSACDDTAAAPTPREAIDALAVIIDRAQRAGAMAPEDYAAFAVYALAVLGPGWQLLPRL